MNLLPKKSKTLNIKSQKALLKSVLATTLLSKEELAKKLGITVTKIEAWEEDGNIAKNYIKDLKSILSEYHKQKNKSNSKLLNSILQQKILTKEELAEKLEVPVTKIDAWEDNSLISKRCIKELEEILSEYEKSEGISENFNTEEIVSEEDRDLLDILENLLIRDEMKIIERDFQSLNFSEEEQDFLDHCYFFCRDKTDYSMENILKAYNLPYEYIREKTLKQIFITEKSIRDKITNSSLSSENAFSLIFSEIEGREEPFVLEDASLKILIKYLNFKGINLKDIYILLNNIVRFSNFKVNPSLIDLKEVSLGSLKNLLTDANELEYLFILSSIKEIPLKGFIQIDEGSVEITRLGRQFIGWYESRLLESSWEEVKEIHSKDEVAIKISQFGSLVFFGEEVFNNLRFKKKITYDEFLDIQYENNHKARIPMINYFGKKGHSFKFRGVLSGYITSSGKILLYEVKFTVNKKTSNIHHFWIDMEEFDSIKDVISENNSTEIEFEADIYMYLRIEDKTIDFSLEKIRNCKILDSDTHDLNLSLSTDYKEFLINFFKNIPIENRKEYININNITSNLKRNFKIPPIELDFLLEKDRNEIQQLSLFDNCGNLNKELIMDE